MIIQYIKYLIHCILVPREYYKLDGKIVVREWFNKPIELGDHMRHDHKFSESEINDLLLEARRLLRAGGDHES